MTLDHCKYNQNCNYFLLLYNHKVYIILITAMFPDLVPFLEQINISNIQLLIWHMFCFTFQLQSNQDDVLFCGGTKVPPFSYISIAYIVLLFSIIWFGAVVLNCSEFSLSGDIFDCYDWIGGCYWHLVGRGQGHWQTSYKAQRRGLSRTIQPQQGLSSPKLTFVKFQSRGTMIILLSYRMLCWTLY